MTPYGYRIGDGQAVIDSEAALNLRQLFKLYLSGFTIEEAKHDSEIPLSTSSASRLLSSAIYLGTEFYPPIIDQETFDRAQVEKKKRNRRPEGLDSRKFIPVTVKTRFRLPTLPIRGSADSCETLAEQIYRSIQSYTPEMEEDAFSTVLDEKKNEYIRYLFQTLP